MARRKSSGLVRILMPRWLLRALTNWLARNRSRSGYQGLRRYKRSYSRKRR